MAFVNVAEWTSQHVGDWLYGLDDSILPYVQFFVNNQINGCRLLLLTAQDLVNLNISKIGHQEIILEAVELLRNLHYNITSETLQTISLRLACKSRALFNQLKKSAEKAAAEAATIASVTDVDNGKKDKKDHHKDKDHHHSHHQNVNRTEVTTIDLSPVSTTTLAAVSDILAAVKDFISWIDRYPFDGNEKYLQTRKAILQLSIELTSTAQRDQFVQGPNEVIRQSCKKLADLCDRLVQELNDSLAMQAASLEVVTVTKNMDEDLGMHIHSSYSGIHVVGGLKYHSPAHLNGNIEEGDEIVQVNYQTVVGWQLKKLVASMRRFPTKLILTVKKRPKNHASGIFTVIPQFALPLPEMSIIGNSSLPLSSSGNVVGHLIPISNLASAGGGCYPSLITPNHFPPQQQPLNDNNLTTTTTTTTTTINTGHYNSMVNSNNSKLVLSSTSTKVQDLMATTSSSSYDTVSNTTNSNSSGFIIGDNKPQNRKPVMFFDSGNSAGVGTGTTGSNNVVGLDRFSSSTENMTNVIDHLFYSTDTKSNNQIISGTTVSSSLKSNKTGKKIISPVEMENSNVDIKQQQQQQISSFKAKNLNNEKNNMETIMTSSGDSTSNNIHRNNNNDDNGRNNTARNRMATTRCSSASDSSPLSDLSDEDDSSTMFSSDTDSESDCIQNHHHRINRFHHNNVDNKKKNINNKKKISIEIHNVNHNIKQPHQTTRTKHQAINRNNPIANGNCSDEFLPSEEEEDETNDNDSAFYSGRRTTISMTSPTISKNDSLKMGGASSVSSSSSCSSSITNNKKNLTNSFVKMKISKKSNEKDEIQSTGGNDSADSGIREREDMEPSSEQPHQLSYHNDNQCSTMEDIVSKNKSVNISSQKTRTTAELEELYLMKNRNAMNVFGSDTRLPNTINTTTMTNVKCFTNSRSSTLPPNTQPNVMTTETIDSTTTITKKDSCKNPKYQNKSLNVTNLDNKLDTTTTTLTSVQLSTITHLTSLAKNIRFANMAQVQNNVLMMNSNNQQKPPPPTNPHSKSKFNPVLAQKLEQRIMRISDGDLVMGNHEDYLYTYKGSERIGGNSSDIPSLGYITDKKQLQKWTKMRSVLRDNCLYSYLNDSVIACFEIPIHLPGYYILVDKQMFLEETKSSDEHKNHDFSENDDDIQTSNIPKQLVVFKLVTYHRLFMFAVDSLKKLVRWIVRFGYRFCCNPTEPQLCFTYYLSPAHYGELPSLSFNRASTLPRLKGGHSTDSSKQEKIINDNIPMTNNLNDLKKSREIVQQNLELSEFESDDYNDLLTVKSNDSGDCHVKFQCQDGRSPSITEDSDGNKDAHRFIKSPHPRGSVRFAVNPPRFIQDLDFIDSTIDAKKTLAENLAEDTQKTIVEQVVEPTANLKCQQSSLDGSVSTLENLNKLIPPELPPRSNSLIVSSTILLPSSSSIIGNQNNDVPRPKPRISKMAVIGSNGTNTLPSTTSPSSPSKTSSMITSAAQRLAPIPLPEKSTHISQTIQHFANLQRQNNLRRSFAQQQQNSLSSLRNSKIATSSQQLHYSDYDYITNRPQVVQQQSSTGNVKHSSKSLAESSTNKTQMTNQKPQQPSSSSFNHSIQTIGNPLYCHIPMPKNFEQTTQLQKLDKNDEQSRIDHEYNRFFEDQKPSEILGSTPRSDDGLLQQLDLDNQGELSFDDHDESRSQSMPPSIEPPPPPPMIDETKTENSFTSNQLSSPKVQARRPTKKQIIQPHTNPSPIAPPKPNRTEIKKDSSLSPPTLLPRRSAVPATENIPPPLPTTAHPLLSKSSSIQQEPEREQNKLLPNSPPPICPKPDFVKCLVAKSSNHHVSKYLNRSFSDAAYGRQATVVVNGTKTTGNNNERTTVKCRNSLESSNDLNNKHDIANDEDERLVSSSPFHRTGSAASFGDVPTFDSSPLSSRFLPTMGVSMLGKKRLSNVSADCSAIEKAINIHTNRQQSSDSSSVNRRPSTSSITSDDNSTYHQTRINNHHSSILNYNE